MPVEIKDQGQYELFETSQHHKILVLDKKRWFAAVKGQQGDILVKSEADHERNRTLQKGRFYFAEFKGDPKFRDLPHMFLEKDGKYQEVVLPNGLPSDRDTQKKIVWTDETMQKDELESYLKHPKTAGASSIASNKDQGGNSGSDNLPIANFDEMTVDEVKGKLGTLSNEELSRLRAYEQQHKKRKTLLTAMERKH